MHACPHLLSHPDLGVRPPGQPLPAPLSTHGGPLAEVFSRWLRQRDDEHHAAEKRALERALRAVSEDAIRREAQRQSALALTDGWTHWTWIVPAATVAGLLGLRIDTTDAQHRLLRRLRDIAGGLDAKADAAAVTRGCEAVRILLDDLRIAEATAPDAPLQWALLQHAGPSAWPDRTSFAANRLAQLWQSHEAGAALLGHGLIALSRNGHPPDRHQLREIAKAGGAVHVTRRFAQRPTTIDDQPFTTGEALTLTLIGTDVTFGDGPHRCPGQSLALASIEAALTWAAAQTSRPWPTTSTPLHLHNLDIPLFDADASTSAQA